MKKNLVIVESPGKIKTISKILGDSYEVKASVGHIMNLPKNDLGVDVDNNFKANYKPIFGKGKVIDGLKKACKGKDKIFLAPDPDREGEAISWNLATILDVDVNSECRVTFNAITEKVVREAVSNPTKINMEKVNAQQARRILDRLVGYKLSPLLWGKVAKGLSAGRVQSAAVYLVFKRESEIEKFIKEEFWTIDVLLETDKKETFSAKLDKKGKKKIGIKNEKQALAVVSDLEKEDFIIDKIDKKKKKKNPPPPYITSTLQQDASRRFGYSAKQTMKIAQQLYEGIDLKRDGGTTGLITYMRTDSIRITEEAVEQAKEYIKKTYSSKYISDRAKKKSSKKKIQDAHEAIRPTSVDHTPESIKKYLDDRQYRLYKTIYNRFLASQMASAIYNTVSFKISAGEYKLSSLGSQLEFDGYLKLYQAIENPKKEKETILPKLNEKDKCNCNEINKLQHFTEPPPRYTEASLIKELEKEGIGRPSTYAVIMDIIILRHYVSRIQKKLYITDLGIVIVKVLIKYFGDIMNVKFTAEFENKLDLIETGEKDHVSLLKKFYSTFVKDLKTAGKEMKKISFKTDIKCDKCGKNYSFIFGSNGKFLACSGYPKCKNTMNLNSDKNYLKTTYDMESELKINDIIASDETIKKEQDVLDEKCPECSSQLVVKTGRYGKFTACSNYPKCKYTKKKELKIDVKCPNEDCDGDVVIKKTRRGKVFYGCSNYPKCKFVSWDRPTGNLCPKCSAFTVFKESKKNGKQEICSNVKAKTCDFSIKLEES